MKLRCLLVINMLFVAFGYAQTSKKVYFIGNSYTEYNNLPELVQKIALSTNDYIDYQSYTPGGSRFQQHASNPVVLNKIAEGNWDYVVLQEQSQLPSFSQQQVAAQVYPYAQQLVNAIKQANPCGSAIFYMTWGRKFGDQPNCNNGLTQVCTYEGMDDALYNSYMQMAANNKSLVSPVGRVWRALREQNPDMELYVADESHPSYIGSVAAAFTFYTVIFKKDPTLSTFVGNLSPTDASTIKAVVKSIVWDHPETWYMGIHDNPTDFKFELLQNGAYQFTSLNPTATTFLWNFGDGTTSTLPDPIHTFQNNGNYTVTLTTNACNTNTTKSQTVEITSLSNTGFNVKDVRIYPNPASDFVYLTTDPSDAISLYDVVGKTINTPVFFTNENVQLDIRNLTSGIYFVHIQRGTEKQIHKLLKK